MTEMERAMVTAMVTRAAGRVTRVTIMATRVTATRMTATRVTMVAEMTANSTKNSARVHNNN